MGKRIKKNLLFIFLLVIQSVGYAELPSREKIDGWMENLGGGESFDPNKSIDWGILPGPFYTPELEIGVGMAIVGLYRPDSDDMVSQNSSISLNGFVSSTGAFGLSFSNYNFFSSDRWRIFVSGYANKMPTYYWGKGYQSGYHNSNKEEYSIEDFSLEPRILYRVGNNSYLGLGWHLNTMHATDLKREQNSQLQLEPNGLSVFSSGVSAYFSYDTRDFIPNPSHGQAVNLTLTDYSPSLGSDNRFKTLEMQFSSYYPFDEKNILAFEVYSQLSDGDVPWNMLALLGNDSRMRGYYEGRYRDRNSLSTQVEYRRKLDWRHGVALWVGAGTLSERKADLGGKPWLPTVGIGYRFEFKPRMNVRLDFGVGERSNGFYFQVGEAF